MLTELRVENLGVIDELGLVLGPGMTVVTGETGAGKTLIVEAIELLVGARADTTLVRAGAAEARVEARFETSGLVLDRPAVPEAVDLESGELVLARVVPADGRSRAYVNGRLVPAGLLAEVGQYLVELHGQHAHRSLLTPSAHRAALDRFAGEAAIDALAAYRDARERLRRIEAELAALGGDERERARDVDLLRFQIVEIDAAGISDADEEHRLEEEEAALADAGAHRLAALEANGALDGSASEGVGRAIEELRDRRPFADVAERLSVLQDELASLARDVRGIGEGIEDDPRRLEDIRERRRLLADLRRKYGDTLGDVVAHRDDAAVRLLRLEDAEATAETLEREREVSRDDAAEAARRLSDVRRRAASGLAEAIEAELHELAMPSARVAVSVATRGDPAEELPADGIDEVELLLSANLGEEPRSLARIASGGELARTMLAARVVLTEAPPTLVFDEVDAGIGGQAGVAVGRKLAALSTGHQVLCVTHLAQVAAFADAHVVVDKQEGGGRTAAQARLVEGAHRVAELSRMLAGVGTARARDHAEELLLTASRERSR